MKPMVLVGIISGFLGSGVFAFSGLTERSVLSLFIGCLIVFALSWVLRPAREDNRPGLAAIATACGMIVITTAGLLVLYPVVGFVIELIVPKSKPLLIFLVPPILFSVSVVATVYSLVVYVVHGGFPRPPMHAPSAHEITAASASAAKPAAPVETAAPGSTASAMPEPETAPEPLPPQERHEPIIRVGTAGRRRGGSTESGEFTTWTGDDDAPGSGPANKA